MQDLQTYPSIFQNKIFRFIQTNKQINRYAGITSFCNERSPHCLLLLGLNQAFEVIKAYLMIKTPYQWGPPQLGMNARAGIVKLTLTFIL